MNPLIPTLLLLLHHIHFSTSQSTSQPPTPSGPTNVTAILEKAGQYTTLMRLMKSTQVADQINTQLNNSQSNGLTLFAPTDNAFSSLPAGTMNSLTDQQKVALIQFHVLPTFMSVAAFQTASNPLRTQAGNANNGQYPLNVTTDGNRAVNVTTGVVNATVSNTVYSDGQLAVYEVDKVLLPLDIFGPASSAAPAPAPSGGGKGSKPSSSASGDTSADGSGDASDGGVRDRKGLAMVGVLIWWLVRMI
ncbi:Fasciclin-like arabinogalactan protein 11 [Acorus calamus]|uniref:Fasciclin-like arabinogalactan protein 11 n=1 Tax=Acorus calamus TaxID=4465 RepID=A0AAV9F707_ACOCL|nr:Fasciclin-like arabinogalactan protein 11 [Acorus calamus]